MIDGTSDSEAADLEPAKVVAARLREARDVAGLTQGDVATALGIARTSVAAFEGGTRKVSVLEIRRLAALYGRSIAWLIGEEDSPDLTGQALYRAASTLSEKDREQVLKFAQFLASAPKNPVPAPRATDKP